MNVDQRSQRPAVLESLIGPVIVGVSIWCAAGLITVASPDSPSTRLAIPAARWIFPLATAAAFLIPAWRRRPMLAMPCIVSTLPWWPVPLPAVALIWTGPLAWLPIVAAAVCAIGAGPLSAAGRMVRASNSRRSTVLAGVLTLVVAAAAAWTVNAHLPGGDEPHYLVVTQSLLKDGDLRIENNYRQRDYDAYFAGDLSPHYVTRGRDGEIYSIHAPGLPALVLPAFALFGYRGAQLLLLLMAAVTGSIVWRIGWRATDDAASAWFAWAAIVGSATFLLHSFAVFPDGPGALVVAAAVLMLLRLRQVPTGTGYASLVVVSALLGGLPWLHTRFAVLAGGFGGAMAWLILADGSRAIGARIGRLVAFAALPLASAIGWFAFFQVIYGTPNPAAPYGATAGTRAAYVPGGLMGLLFDQQFGLLIYTPVLIATATGLGRIADRSARWTAWSTSAIACAYLAAVATYWLWWAGSPANPARFTVAVLPVFAMPLATCWQTADANRRRMLATLLAASLTITGALVIVDRGSLAWNMRNAEALWLDWLSPVANLPRAWPSFFWGLDPAKLGSEGPFLLHIALWMTPFVGGWLIVRRLGVARSWTPEVWRLAVSCWLIAGLSVATQLGWSLNGATGLDPARSQMAVIDARQPVVEISRLSVRRLSGSAGAIQVRSEEPGQLDGPAPWLRLESVPAGRYMLRIASARPRSGQLLVMVGRAPQPIRTVSLKPLSRQTAVLTLPAGAAALTIAPDRELENISGHIDLEPMELSNDPRFARVAIPYQSVNVFFLDDNTFVEPEGFWVRGGQSAELVVEAPSGGSIPITIRNGGAPNTVVIRAETIGRLEPLAPFESRTIDLSAAEAGPLHLTITSQSGFRPSDDGKSRDTRYLGVWVSVR